LFDFQQQHEAIIGPDNQPVVGLTFIRTPSPDLRWEETRMINLGIDFSLWSGRLGGSIDFFDKRTKDFLFQTPGDEAPTSLVWTNLDGEIINKGVELQLSAGIINQSTFEWNANLAFTRVRNEVQGVPGQIPVGIIQGGGTGTVSPQVITSNASLGAFYGRHWLGLMKMDLISLNRIKQVSPFFE